MPGGDRTGPVGFGPMSGRGFGFCAGFNRPGFLAPFGRFGYGRGFGRGFGRGWFWRSQLYLGNPYLFNPYYQGQYTTSNELEDLKAERDNIKAMLEDIQKRIEELEKSET